MGGSISSLWFFLRIGERKLCTSFGKLIKGAKNEGEIESIDLPSGM